jgi:multiple sugar transport system substrate-binding protein
MVEKLSRRVFLQMSLLVGSATLLAACAPRVTPEPTPGPEQEQPAAPAPEDVVEISFMGWGGTEEDKGVRDAITQFESEQGEVKVVWWHTPDRYAEVLLANVAAGTPPDTAFIGSDVFTTYARDGMLADITEMLKGDPLIGREGYFIEPQETERSTYKGRWYGIGSCWVAPHIYYNADIFAEAGIEPPSPDPAKAWDWPTLLEIGARLTVDANGKHAGESGFDPENIDRWAIDWPTWWIPVHSLIASNEGHYVNRETGLLELDQPPAMEAMQAQADLRNVHYIMPASGTMEQLGMGNTQMLETRKLAMAVDGSWALAWMWKMKAPLGCAVLPKLKVPATNMQAHLHSMLSGTEHPEAAWQWLRFLATPFYQTMFCRMGLWLPSQTDLMTEAGLKTWINDEVHPEGYAQIVTDFVVNHGQVLYMPPGWPKVADIINPALDPVWIGEAKVAEVMPAAVAEANAILKEEAIR